jgi:putative holliday junction resolvase
VPARIVLGFDFGKKRIGIATGDTVTGAAAPFGAIPATAAGTDWGAIERLLTQFKPEVLVVGSPRHADGTESALSGAADRFAAELGRRAGVPVERCDEYGSSIEATEALRGARRAGTHARRLQRGDIDGAAAAIILQRWLQAEGRLR